MEVNLEQLKAHAYDCVRQINIWQRELQVVEQKIAEKEAKLKKETPKEVDS